VTGTFGLFTLCAFDFGRSGSGAHSHNLRPDLPLQLMTFVTHGNCQSPAVSGRSGGSGL
jgi:hypothetical protein